MTVTYLQHIQTSGSCGFLSLLLLWKGSVWKGIWKNLAVWIFLWYLIQSIYQIILTKDKNANLKGTFEEICMFFEANEDNIPLAFILGFYVTQIGKIDKPESKSQVQAQSQMEKGKGNLDSGLSLKSHGP